jgi:predicted metal-binding protein
MVDRLKKSLEHLDPPYCPNCNREMNWSRSSLEDAVTIVHVFLCSGCSNITETRTTVRATSIPPKKLSAPHRQAA